MTSILFRRMNRTLRHIKYRAAGSASLIIVSVAIYISIAAMIPSAERALEGKVEELHLNDYMVHVRAGNESEAAALSTIPGVETVDTRLHLSSRVEYGRGGERRNVTAALVGIDPSRRPLVNIPQVMEGGHLEGNGTALLERNFAKKVGLGVGDTVLALTGTGWEELRIVGLVLSPEHLVLSMNPQALLPFPGNLAVLFVPDDWLRVSFGLGPESVNEFLFLLEGAGGSARKDIDAALSGDIILFTLNKDEVYGYALTKEDLRQGNSWAGIIAFVMLLVAFFITYISFTRLVQEQRREIGVLRALGYSRAALLGSYLHMALLIGLAGSLVGLLIGAPIAQGMAGFYVEIMIGTPLAAFVLPLSALATGFLFGPLTAVLACGVAVWGTVSMEPQEAIRGTPRALLLRRRTSGRKRSPPIRGSYLTHYALRNLLHHGVRTTITVLALAGSIVIGAMALLMWPAFTNSLSEGLHETERWDLLVEYSYPLDANEASAMEPPGATQSAQISRMTAEWRHAGREGMALVVGLERNQSLHLFKVREGRRASSPDEAMVERGLAREKGIRVGAHMTLTGPGGSSELLVSGVVEDFLGEIFVDPEVLHSLACETLYSGVYLKLPKGEASEMRRALLSSPLVTDVYTPDSAQSGILEFMASYENIIYIFSLLGVAMAAVTISNIIFVSVLERWMEYGQLRAIGYSRRAVASSILSEIFIMVGVASLIGAPLTYGLVLSLEEELRAFFPMYSTVIYPRDWVGYLFVIGMTVLFTLLAAAPSIRSVNRMDLVKTVAGERFG